MEPLGAFEANLLPEASVACLKLTVYFPLSWCLSPGCPGWGQGCWTGGPPQAGVVGKESSWNPAGTQPRVTDTVKREGASRLDVAALGVLGSR